MIVSSIRFAARSFRPLDNSVSHTNQIYKSSHSNVIPVDFNTSHKYCFSLQSKAQEYIKDKNKLKLDDHVKYFYTFLQTPQEVDFKSLYWKLLTKELLRQFNQISAPKKAQMLRRLKLINKDCQLKVELENEVLNNINKLNVVGLCRILQSLTIHKNITPQMQSTYSLLYNRFFQIFSFFTNENYLKMRQTQRIEYLSQYEISFLKGENQQTQNSMFAQVSQTRFLFDQQLYFKCCRQLYKVKLSNPQYNWFFYWFLTAAFTGKDAKSNIQRFNIDLLKILFIHYSKFQKKIIYSAENLVRDFPCRIIEHIIEAETQSQVNIFDNKGLVFFLFYQSLLKMMRNLFIVLTSKTVKIDTQKRNYYQTLYKKCKVYVNSSFQKIYAHRNQFKTQSEKLHLTQILSLYLQSAAAQIQIFKNLLQYVVVDFKLKNVKYQKFNNIANAIISAKLSKQNRLKILPYEKIIWTFIWKQYPKMIPKDRQFVKTMVARNKGTAQFEVCVPNNIVI